jgi:heme/copper-type cytochrome/quinol oxidase subunit 2
MTRDAPASQPRNIAGSPRKRREIDWVQILINVTLLVAAVIFLLIAGIMVWTLY